MALVMLSILVLLIPVCIYVSHKIIQEYLTYLFKFFIDNVDNLNEKNESMFISTNKKIDLIDDRWKIIGEYMEKKDKKNNGNTTSTS